MSRFMLPFGIRHVEKFAERYTYPENDGKPAAAGAAGRAQGYLTKAQFMEIAGWKSPRPKPWHAMNAPSDVKRLTRLAFSTKDENERIVTLTKLRGVQWRTATAILHLVYTDRFPLADVRAFRTLQVDISETFNVEVWLDYVHFCKETAKQAGVSLRTLDMALWAYDRIQNPRKSRWCAPA